MNTHSPRFRGFAAVRADTGDIANTLTTLNQTFAAFREQNDRRLADLERGREDVVTNEHVDRINASLGELTATVNAQREQLDAIQLNGNGGQQGASPEMRAYSQAFNQWFRSGDNSVEATLNGLAVRAALTTQSEPDGGFVVPEEMDGTIARVLANQTAMRGLARVVSTTGGGYKTLTSQGGAGSGWVGEEASRSSTATPTLSEITVPAGEIYANAYATQRLLEDASIDIAAWLADEVGITFAEQEGSAFISGNGVNRPMGFLSYTQIANASYAWGKIGFVATGTSGAFATAGADNFISLYGALKPGYRNNGTFLMSDATLTVARAFKDTTNNYIWAPPTVNGPDTILGKPVVTDDAMPTIAANSYSVAFGDFRRGYLINDRRGAQVLRDPYTNKPYVNFYTTKRVGGGVVNFEAIKTLKFA
jgi:HK97 family phage major capsid protein